MSDIAWQAIFDSYDIHNHDFNIDPFFIMSKEIKDATSHFKETKHTEPRILCKHDTRESRPKLFSDNNIFILPVKNGKYALIKGEGYIDIPPIPDDTETYISNLDFHLDTAFVGNSEMQHLDYAYATSLIRSVMDDDSLVLTIRGRKYTPEINFRVGEHEIEADNVMMNIHGSYEGREKALHVIVMLEKERNLAKHKIYYPYHYLCSFISKPVFTLVLQPLSKDVYAIGLFQQENKETFGGFQLVRHHKFAIINRESI
ncbi:MAG: hypothetical protein AAFQ07_05850 [Chloroflexota bacterium]